MDLVETTCRNDLQTCISTRVLEPHPDIVLCVVEHERSVPIWFQDAADFCESRSHEPPVVLQRLASIPRPTVDVHHQLLLFVGDPSEPCIPKQAAVCVEDVRPER